jgi:hypothetical protein
MLSSSLNTPAATVLLSSEALNVVTSATHSAAVTESVSENESERDGEEDGPGVGGSHCHPCVQWVVRGEGGRLRIRRCGMVTKVCQLSKEARARSPPLA